MDVEAVKAVEVSLTFWSHVKTISTLLVVLGVAGEFLQDYLSAPKQKLVDDFQKMEIVRLNSEVVAAKKRIEPRELSDEQRKKMSNALKGKISKILFVVQKETEAELFSLKLIMAIDDKTIQIQKLEMPPGESVGLGGGLLLFIPGKETGLSTEEAKSDPVYSALTSVGLQIGLTNFPTMWRSQGPNVPMLSKDGYILFVGQKPLY
jgi:hypothetical protein